MQLRMNMRAAAGGSAAGLGRVGPLGGRGVGDDVLGQERRVLIEAARVDRCTVAGVGLTVCRARDQCDSLGPPDPLISGRPGPVARGVSSEPIATRRLSEQRSTTSASRPRTRAL